MGLARDAAMPPKARRKLGYNWRARQSQHMTSEGGLRLSRASGRTSEDPNALILPSKPRKPLKATDEAVSKRKRLSCKQKKRLMKILEVKEKKAKVSSKQRAPHVLTHFREVEHIHLTTRTHK